MTFRVVHQPSTNQARCLCCFNSSRAGRLTDFLPPAAEYDGLRSNPRQGWWERSRPVACQSFAASRVPKCSKHPAQRRSVDGSGDRDASAHPEQIAPSCCPIGATTPTLLPVVEAVEPCWWRPIGQHSECLFQDFGRFKTTMRSCGPRVVSGPPRRSGGFRRTSHARSCDILTFSRGKEAKRRVRGRSRGGSRLWR